MFRTEASVAKASTGVKAWLQGETKLIKATQIAASKGQSIGYVHAADDFFTPIVSETVETNFNYFTDVARGKKEFSMKGLLGENVMSLTSNFTSGVFKLPGNFFKNGVGLNSFHDESVISRITMHTMHEGPGLLGDYFGSEFLRIHFGAEDIISDSNRNQRENIPETIGTILKSARS